MSLLEAGMTECFTAAEETLKQDMSVCSVCVGLCVLKPLCCLLPSRQDFALLLLNNHN